MASKSAQIHNIRLLGSGLKPGRKTLTVVAEYEPQSPRSIITRRHVDALQVEIEPLPQPITTIFEDRYRVFYVPLGTVMLRWYKNARSVNAKFYVVNTLSPGYAAKNVDVVLGGAEDVDGVIANLFDVSVPVSPIFSTALSKEQKEKQKKEKQRKEEEVEQAVRDEEAAEREQRDVERQVRLKSNSNSNNPEQQSSP